MHLPCTVQHILVSKVKKILFLECARRTRYTQAHASTYWYILSRTHTKVTTTFRFKSGIIRLAMPACFPTTLDPFIARSFLPLCSILPRQNTQAGLAAPKLPQQGVNLIDITRCVGAPEREAGFCRNPCGRLALAELVRDHQS
jgi:hypothetical protein